MEIKTYGLTFFFLVLTLAGKAQLTVDGYTNYDLSGFNVLVEDSAFMANSTLTNTAIDLMETKLTEIVGFNISQTKIDSLKAVPIFMDWNTTSGAAQYHPSETWLIANGYIPEKARCVEISNITNFVNWVNQNQPYMVLHELAHAYHHRVLFFNNFTITNAFNNAIANNLYTNVSYHHGNGIYSTQPAAYGLNNEREFFAELTEAYFGFNDYFPFNYTDLNTYDIVGFNAMATIWGNIIASNGTSTAVDGQVLVYPNPTSSIVRIILNHQEQIERLELWDVKGKKLASKPNNNQGQLFIDLADEPPGVYVLRLIQADRVKAVQVLKK